VVNIVYTDLPSPSPPSNFVLLVFASDFSAKLKVGKVQGLGDFNPLHCGPQNHTLENVRNLAMMITMVCFLTLLCALNGICASLGLLSALR